ncbi:peptidase [Arenibacter sp. N53]|uniref:proprotein convertase P-domain-containing protein n=1 Tax=Arenibacter TaxID=178469 RepID=UPI000CD47631|nr:MULTISPECIES: proprotein convertase P-domain-containing protein [Arenibacter]MCM4151503.1 peptidase [Arenibacter sp. N53]
MAKNIKSDERLYTYRNGKKVYLKKESDQFVVRALPAELEKMGITKDVEKVSSASSRVKVKSNKLDSEIADMRKEAVTHHAYKQEANNEEFLITDRIIVTFKKSVSNEQLSKFIAKYALILMTKYSDREYLLQLTDQTGMNPVKLVVLINESESRLVEFCEHDLNKRMTMSNVNVPVDPKYVQQWHLHSRMTNTSFDPRSSANCEAAWNLLSNYGSQDVVIAVTDDGCKLDHLDFDSINKFAQWGYMSGSSLITRDTIGGNPQNMYQYGSNHGTSCNGVVAAEIDGVLTVGAAPGCRLLPIKWESSGPGLFISDSKMMTVLTFIGDKADVLSNSWGSSPSFVFALNVINKITQLAQNGGRRGKGIIFLWAAGNENCPIKYSGNKDIPFDNGFNASGNWAGVQTSRIFEHNLVGVPGVMHIAALASNAQRSHYSNYGEGISLCAPSSNSHEYWRMAVTGLGITTTTGRSPFFDSEFGGTSSATPLVAGIAGLVISANPDLTAIEVVSILQRTAAKDLNMTSYPKTPPAPYDPDTSWDISPISPWNNGNFNNSGNPDGSWSGWFGFGKVDASAAVDEALRLKGGSASNEEIVTQTSAPAKVIPDNNLAGITDVIHITGAGTVASIKVGLNITHTYVGDLVIKITSPKGTSVILHNRNGGGADNINTIYDRQNIAPLSNFNGENANGNWTLAVADLGNLDTGKLNSWTLHVGSVQSQTIILEEAPGIQIPDNNPIGIERTLISTAEGTINNTEVGMDITHTYINDLIINLVSPKGTEINLHNKIGGSADNIIKVYDFNNNLKLRSLKGEQIQGNWKLKISDVAGQDVGKLNKWSIKINKQ